MTLIILIIILVLLFGGGGWYGYNAGYYGAAPFGLVQVLLIIVVLWLVLGR